jgi:hypothetical protein
MSVTLTMYLYLKHQLEKSETLSDRDYGERLELMVKMMKMMKRLPLMEGARSYPRYQTLWL